MIKKALKIKLYIVTVILIVVITAAFVLSRNPFKWDFNIFGGELEIDETENVIEEIRKISEFTTACYYQELVIKDYKSEPTILDNVSKAMHLGGDSCRYELVLIAKGSVRAGYNLENVGKDDISVSSDTITVTLPHAEVLDVIVNPSDCEVYTEEGSWTNEEIAQVKSKTSEKLRRNALKGGLLEKADKSGVDKIKTLFKSFGFKVVRVSFKEE